MSCGEAGMGNWTKVKWTEAGQVTALLDWNPVDASKLVAAPKAFFTDLRTQGRLDEAAMFLGQALPRYEVVAWATRVLRDIKAADPAQGPADLQALDAAQAWLKDPSEPNRRAALAASSAASDGAPERFAALAAYFSGGSMAPDNCPPVPPPREAAGKFAAAAVILAATRSPDRPAALARALDLGETLADGGRGAGDA
jgi:hypothetical protein